MGSSDFGIILEELEILKIDERVRLDRFYGPFLRVTSSPNKKMCRCFIIILLAKKTCSKLTLFKNYRDKIEAEQIGAGKNEDYFSICA